MDEALSPRLRAAALSAALLALAASVPARAQALQDPTRPPASSASWGGAAPSGNGGGPQLQSILVAREPGGRHLAVIDGQPVRIGDTVEGARVVRIGENEVELARGKERQVLRLYAQEASGITPVRTHARRQGP